MHLFLPVYLSDMYPKAHQALNHPHWHDPQVRGGFCTPQYTCSNQCTDSNLSLDLAVSWLPPLFCDANERGDMGLSADQILPVQI